MCRFSVQSVHVCCACICCVQVGIRLGCAESSVESFPKHVGLYSYGLPSHPLCLPLVACLLIWWRIASRHFICYSVGWAFEPRCIQAAVGLASSAWFPVSSLHSWAWLAARVLLPLVAWLDLSAVELFGSCACWFAPQAYFQKIDWEGTRRWACSCPEARAVASGASWSPAALKATGGDTADRCIWSGCDELGTFDHITWSRPHCPQWSRLFHHGRVNL